MHVRFSMIRGLPVISEDDEETQGFLGDVLIHPDTGALEGFFVYRYSLLGGMQELFLSSHDIHSVGTVVRISSADMMGDPQDVLRLGILLEDPRTVMGQKILTEKEGTYLGRLSDIQFDTRRMHMEWMFPKKWWLTCTPIPVGEIVRIEPHAIIVKEPLRAVPVEQEEEKISVPALTEIVPKPTT
jgi:uncharacterized protein YrrD